MLKMFVPETFYVFLSELSQTPSRWRCNNRDMAVEWRPTFLTIFLWLTSCWYNAKMGLFSLLKRWLLSSMLWYHAVWTIEFLIGLSAEWLTVFISIYLFADFGDICWESGTKCYLKKRWNFILEYFSNSLNCGRRVIIWHSIPIFDTLVLRWTLTLLSLNLCTVRPV